MATNSVMSLPHLSPLLDLCCTIAASIISGGRPLLLSGLYHYEHCISVTHCLVGCCNVAVCMYVCMYACMLCMYVSKYVSK